MTKAAMVRPTGLSDNEVVLLGLIAEEPTHAYGVEEKVRARRMEEWTDIGFSSTYRLLAALERRGFLASLLVQDGQGAARRVHAITPKGRRVLAEAVLEHLGDFAPIKLPFQLGLAYLAHAPSTHVSPRLRERGEAIRLGIDDVGALLRAHRQERPRTGDGLAYRRWLGVQLFLEHVRTHLRVEQCFVARARELLARSAPRPSNRRRRPRS